MSATERHKDKSYAALYYALGLTRGVLGDVIDGQFDRDKLRRVYEATAAFRIAASIEMKESDVAIDWDQHLTNAEKSKIQGFQNAEPSAPTNGGLASSLDESGTTEEPSSLN